MEEQKDKQAASLEASEPGQLNPSTPPADADSAASSGDPATPGATPDMQTAPNAPAPKEEKVSPLKRLMRRVDIYFLSFLLLCIVVAAFAIVNYLNSKKVPVAPSAISQNLTTDQLKQLASSNASVGNSGQTVTVQGNAIFAGQVLVQKDLDVAGSIKLGGELLAQNFTAAGKVNLADTQAKSLQVQSNTTLQGDVTAQHNLNVGGSSTFSGPITATTLTVTNLSLSGNAILSVPNHVAFQGPSPTRGAISTGSLGQGGSASLNGSDTSGTVNINTGNHPVAGCFIIINFNRPFSATPHVIISPIGAGAGQTQYYATRTTTSMSICAANDPPANSNFAFDYFVAG